MTSPPASYRIRIDPAKVLGGTVSLNPLEAVLFPEESVVAGAREFEISLDDVMVRARQHFHLGPPEAAALQRTVARFFGGTRVARGDDGQDHTVRVSRDHVLDTMGEWSFIGPALYAIDLEIVKAFAAKSHEVAAWKAMPESVAAALGRLVSDVSNVMVDGINNDALAAEVATTLAHIDWQPLAEMEIQKQWMTFHALGTTQPLLADVLLALFPASNTAHYTGPAALQEIFAKIFVNALQKLPPESISPELIMSAIFHARENPALREALYGQPPSAVIDQLLSLRITPGKARFIYVELYRIMALCTAARNGHPAALRVIGEMLKNRAHPLWAEAIASPSYDLDLILGVVLQELADPDFVNAPLLNDARAADYRAVKKTVQAWLRSIVQRADTDAGFLLRAFLVGEDNGKNGARIYAEWETRWKNADQKYQPGTLSQIKAYCSAPKLSGKESQNGVSALQALMTAGADTAVDRLEDLVRSVSDVTADAFDALALYAVDTSVENSAMSSALRPRVDQFLAHDIPIDGTVNYLTHRLKIYEAKYGRDFPVDSDHPPPWRIGLLGLLLTERRDREFANTYAIYARLELTFTNKALVPTIVDGLGTLDAEQRYAIQTTAPPPLDILQQMVTSGHVAADAAWARIKSNTQNLLSGDKAEALHAHVQTMLTIATDGAATNTHQLDALEFLLSMVHEGNVEQLPTSAAAELISQLRHLGVSNFSERLSDPQQQSRVLAVLTQLTYLKNASAWLVIQSAFENNPPPYFATLQTFLADDKFPYHADLVALAATHVAAPDDALFASCHDLLIAAVQSDRAGAWAAVGGLAIADVGTASAAVTTLLENVSAQNEAEQRAAVNAFDAVLAAYISNEENFDPFAGDALDPLLGDQANTLAEREAGESFTAVQCYELNRQLALENEHAAVDSSFDNTTGTMIHSAAMVNAVPAASGDQLASVEAQIAAVFNETASPETVASSVQSLTALSAQHDPVVQAAAFQALGNAVFAPTISGELLDTILHTLVERGVIQQPPVSAAHDQLLALIEDCRVEMLDDVANENFYRAILQRIVQLGHDQPAEAVKALHDF